MIKNDGTQKLHRWGGQIWINISAKNESLWAHENLNTLICLKILASIYLVLSLKFGRKIDESWKNEIWVGGDY